MHRDKTLMIGRRTGEPLFRAERNLSMKGIALYMFDLDPRDPAAEAPGECVAPLCYLNDQDAQVLMDDLWAAGTRPTEGAGSAGALAATQKHLAEVSGLLAAVLPHALGAAGE